MCSVPSAHKQALFARGETRRHLGDVHVLAGVLLEITRVCPALFYI